MSKPSQNGTLASPDIDALAEVGTIKTRDLEELWMQFLVGAANLTAISIQGRAHASADWFDIATTSGDFTTPEGPILGASGDLTTAAAGSTVHWVKMNVKGLHDLRISAAGNSSTIAGFWGGN